MRGKESFVPYLNEVGILHRLLVLTPIQYQNRVVEHRHIVELGLSLLSHASLPLSFWDHAFVTAVYLINRLPSAPLNFYTPYDVLFCSILFLITHSLKSLAELAILFCILITLTSLNFAPLSVSSLDIPPVLKGTSVCLPLVVFLSPKMFSLMNSSFPILNCFLLHLPLQLHQHPYLSPPL